MDIEKELQAALFAMNPHVHKDSIPELRAAGYGLWVNGFGRRKVLRYRPVCGEGPWKSVPLESALESCEAMAQRGSSASTELAPSS